MTMPRGSALSGRLALITGANRGIGLPLRRALAREGCNLVITGRDERALVKAQAELEKLQSSSHSAKTTKKTKPFVLAQSCDVRSPESVDYLFALVRGLHKPLDILVNNAGIGHAIRTVSDLPYPTWMEVIDTNLNGLFLMTQAALAVMKRGSKHREQSVRRCRARLPWFGGLQRVEARSAWLHQHVARRVASQGDSSDCAHARRHRHGDLENAMAQSAKAQNDVSRDGGTRGD